MIESTNPEIDVDRLMAEIRESLAREPGTPSPRVLVEPAFGRGPERWATLLQALDVAEQNAAVGASPPPFNNFHPLLRRPARFAARFVLALAELATRPQRAVNIALVQTLRLLVEQIRELEHECEALRVLSQQSSAAGGAPPGEDAKRP